MFFSLEKYFKDIKKTFQVKKIENKIFAINGGRNIGKSTSALKYAEKKSLKEDAKFVYLRNTGEQLLAAIKDLNNRFYQKFYFTMTHIYKLRATKKKNIDGDIETIYVKDKVVGYCGTINAFDKLKSVEAANINFILYEEYNEDTGRMVGIYKKFVNLITTLVRFNKDVVIVMLGNRDTANNEFMVNWGVEPREDLYEDITYQVDNMIYFTEIGDKTFLGLNNDKTIFYNLAQYDEETKRYLGGGYIDGYKLDVINYDKRIKDTKEIYFYLSSGDYFEIGTFNHWKFGKSLYIHMVQYDKVEKGKMVINTSILGSMTHGNSEKADDDDLKEIADFIYHYAISKKLFYSSFDVKILIGGWVSLLLKKYY